MQPRDAARLLFSAHQDGALLASGTVAELQNPLFAVETARELDRLRDPSGTRAGGWKIGYTSEAMRRQMGIKEPNAAPIYRDLILGSGELHMPLTHPRIEPEVSIQLNKTVEWRALSSVDPTERLSYLADRTASARCALEVVDSVWSDYAFTWGENTADGSSGAAAVLGDEIPALSMLGNLSVRLETVAGPNEREVAVSTGHDSDVLGNPLAAVAWLARYLDDFGLAIEAGYVVLTGGITASQSLAAGCHATARFSSGSWTGSVTASRDT